MRLSVVLLSLLSASALAAPVTFQHQGRLWDSTSLPLDGTHSVTVSLYDVTSGGTALWSQTTDEVFDNGYFSLELADVDDALIDGSMLYMGIAIDGGTELPTRLDLHWVPMAVHARSLSGGPVDASEIRVGGTAIVDNTGAFVADVDWTQIQNAPTTSGTDTLTDLGCSAAGDLAMADGSGGWSCVNEDALDIAAGQISGVLDVTQIPVGTGSSQVAAGDHGHTAADIGALPDTATAADIGALPDTTTASDIGALPDTTTAADIGAMPAATGGGLVVTDSTAPCDDSAQYGTMRFTAAGALEVCGEVGWVQVAATRMNGTSQAGAGQSCKQLKTDFPSLGTGVYWIDPNGGSTADAFEVYCDMIYDGGGWTLVMKLAQGDFCWGSGRWTDGASYRAANTLDSTQPTEDAKSLAFHELTDVTELHLVTQDGDLEADFTVAASPENLMTTNDVPFATYPVWSDWRDVFGPGRERAPIFMRAGQAVTDPAGCRTNPGVTPDGCGQLCMFCYQASDGSGCGASTANDVVFGMGGDPAYCGSGSTAYCSTGGTWSDPNNRTIVWAR